MKSPVLFIVFNREKTASCSIARIREVKPPRLYIAADGPRTNHPNEDKVCEAVRQTVLNAIDWDCQVTTLFRTANLGCKNSVSSAISWFFEHEESGVIIEDDCVPSLSFFRFCDELLDRYQENEKILSICASCFQPKSPCGDQSYYFSKYTHCWGWATWRRAWKLYDKNLESWPSFKKAGGLARYSDGCAVYVDHFSRIYDEVHAGKIDTWDFQWTFVGVSHDMVSIIPSVNLSQNIGFGKDSTHTDESNDWMANLPVSEIAFPLVHPQEIVRNITADRWSDIHLWHIRRFQPLIHFFSQSAILRLLYHKIYMPLLRRNRHETK